MVKEIVSIMRHTHMLSTYAFVLYYLQYSTLKEPFTTMKDESITKYMKSVHFIYVLEISEIGILTNKNSMHCCASRYTFETSP